MNSIIGNKYNLLTVISTSDKRTASQAILFKCKCDCGNITYVTSTKLKSGHTKSCGCIKNKVKNLSGMQFGRLTAISFEKRVGKQTYWKCLCECGKQINARADHLQSGDIKSCGCLNDEVRKQTIKKRMKFVDGTSLVAISSKRKLNKNNTSGYRGVTWSNDRKKWVAQITFKRKGYLIGRFDTLSEAIKSRKKAEKELFKT